jgi:hypothetical protein
MRNKAQTRLGFTSLIGLAPTSYAIAILVATTVTPLPAVAQAIFGAGVLSSREVVGGTGPLAMGEGRTQMSSPLVGSQRNTDPTGKPCLNVHAYSEQQKLNKTIYDHILLLDNHCSKTIRIRACYYKTDSCQEISVAGYKRQSHVFGVFTTPDFRFAFREYVN